MHYPFLPVFAIGPRAERFTLNPNTGELRSSSPLSHSERPEYSFIVLVSDRGSPPQSSTIALKIQVSPPPDWTYETLARLRHT